MKRKKKKKKRTNKEILTKFIRKAVEIFLFFLNTFIHCVIHFYLYTEAMQNNYIPLINLLSKFKMKQEIIHLF